VGILRVSGAICTPQVLAVWTDFASTREESRAFVAIPAHPLHGPFPYQILSAGLARLCQHKRVREALIIVHFNANFTRYRYFWLRFWLLLQTLVLFGWESGAFLAISMVTLWTHSVASKGRVASMTCPVDAHADWFFGSVDGVLGSERGPLVWFYGYVVALYYPPRAISLDFRPQNLRDNWSSFC
jgi:hypothetical protein